jgi:hypothetical protein
MIIKMSRKYVAQRKEGRAISSTVSNRRENVDLIVPTSAAKSRHFLDCSDFSDN